MSEPGWAPAIARRGAKPGIFYRAFNPIVRSAPCSAKRVASRLSRGLSAADGVDLFVGRKPAGLFLGIGKPAVDRDVEDATPARHQLDLGAVFCDQPVPRTEGPGLIVSRLAPIDPDFHR